MPLSDFDKYKEIEAEIAAEKDPKRKKVKEKAAARYLKIDLKKSNPSYGVRSMLFFSAGILILVILLFTGLWLFLPWQKALGASTFSGLGLFLIYLFTLRSTHHITGKELNEGTKIGFDGFTGLLKTFNLKDASEKIESSAGEVASVSADATKPEARKSPKVDF